MKYTLFIISVLLTGTTGRPQSLSRATVDSMRRVLQHSGNDSQRAYLQAEIALQWAEAAPDSALRMAREGAATAKAAGQEGMYARCLRSIGWCFFRMEKYDSAEIYMNRAIDLFHARHNVRDEAHALMNITSLYDYQNNNEKKMASLLRGLPLMETLKDSLGGAYAEELIASCYIKEHLYDKAMPYLAHALPVLQILHQDAFLGLGYLYQAVLYDSLKRYDSALIGYKKAIQIYRRCTFVAGEAAATDGVANIFLSRTDGQVKHPDTDSALYYFRQGYRLNSTTHRGISVAADQMDIGETLLLLGRFDEAIQNLAAALTVFVQEKAPQYEYETTLYLSKVYKAKGDYKRAVDYLEQAGRFKDSADAANRKETMARMFAQYETDKKDRTIQLLNAQKALADKELSRNRVVAFFSFCLTALVIALAVVVWKQVRTRNRLKEVEMRNQIAGDLHDDIGSSLSSILLLSNMAARKGERAESGKALETIGVTAKEVMEKMSDIVWTMNPLNDEGGSIRDRIEKLAAQTGEMASLPITIAISPRLEEIKMPMELRKNIFLICKEALNNIIKHAQATAVRLSIEVDHKRLRLEITDNGRGFDPGIESRGNGMGTMAERARTCGGVFRVRSGPGEGSCIEVELPVPHSRYRVTV